MSADNKTAMIELTSKLTEGEYTVKVAQKDKDALTGSVTVQNEKVTAIEVLSDQAPMADGNKATAAYQVTNQYGEDITKLYGASLVKTVTGAANGATVKSDGSIEFNLVSGAKLDDKINITLVDGATGVSTTKQLTLSNKSAAAKATVGALYNKDGKELTEGTTDFSKDKFYLPVTVVDQYGKEVTSATRANNELVVTNTNPAVVDFLGTADNKIKEVTIDGKQVLALEVSKAGLAGTSNVLFISKTTGANSTATVTVNEGLKFNSVTLSSPSELVTAKKDIMFPLMVTDTKGNEIKTKAELAKVKDNITTSVGEVVEVKDKGLFVKVTHNAVPGAKEVNVTKDVPVTVVVTTTSGKVSTQTVTPKAEAVATVITGLDKDIRTALLSNDTTGSVISNTDLMVEDQYGQVITDEDILKDLEFQVTAPSATTFTLANDASANKKWTVKPVVGTEKSSEVLTFKLINGAAPVEASAFTKAFTVVKNSDFASFKVEDLSPIYVNADNEVVAAYNTEKMVVNATTASGEVVKLVEDKDFTVTGKPANGAKVNFESNATTAKKNVTITINATGETLTKEITYSNVAPKVADVKIVTNTKAPAMVAGTEKLVEVKDIEWTNAAAFDIEALKSKVDFIVTDTYGVSVAANETTGVKVTLADGSTPAIDATLTFNKVSGDLIFDKNGASDASVKEFTANSVFNTVVKFSGVAANPLKVTATLKNTPTADAAAANASISAAKANLATPTISVAGDNLGSLPTTVGDTGVTVAWTSAAGTYVSNAGAFVSGPGSEVLTATITKASGTQQTKAFTVTTDASKITNIVVTP
ncbi:Uncharacterised protein [Lysinibacillus sphaericus]|nr:Uncharacterised protein [Lysinibacillus sphaericus]